MDAIAKANIRDRFISYAGKEKFDKFVSVLADNARDKGRLLYWQEELWRRFIQTSELTVPVDYKEIADIFEADIFEADKLKEKERKRQKKIDFWRNLPHQTLKKGLYVALFIAASPGHWIIWAFKKLFGKRCAQCGKSLSESMPVALSGAKFVIFSGKDMLDAMSKKFSLAVFCKNCGVHYCAGCALEAWQKGGPERFICPCCGIDIGDASVVL